MNARPLSVLSEPESGQVHWGHGHRLRVSHELPVELRATVRFQTHGLERSIKVILRGAIVTHEPAWRLLFPADPKGHGRPWPWPPVPQPAVMGGQPFEIESITTDRLASAEPSAWIQLIDERGAALVSQNFLGPAVHAAYPVRARFTVPVAIRVSAGSTVAERALEQGRTRVGLDVQLRYGLYAGLLFRTPSDGPRRCAHVESCLMPLLAAGDHFRYPDLRVPAVRGSAGWQSIARTSACAREVSRELIGFQMLGKAGW